jgi:hypothetical protein
MVVRIDAADNTSFPLYLSCSDFLRLSHTFMTFFLTPFFSLTHAHVHDNTHSQAHSQKHARTHTQTHKLTHHHPNNPPISTQILISPKIVLPPTLPLSPLPSHYPCFKNSSTTTSSFPSLPLQPTFLSHQQLAPSYAGKPTSTPANPDPKPPAL